MLQGVRWTVPYGHEQLIEELKKIPGVVVRRKGTGYSVRASGDLADTVEQQVGRPGLRDYSNPINVDLARLPSKLHPWQRAGAEALARGEKFGLFWACVAGSTIVTAHRAGKSYQTTIARLAAQTTAGYQRADIDTYVQASDGSNIVLRKLLAVHVNGLQPIYELESLAGHKIRATANHLFMTPDGWREMRQLRAGDRVLRSTKPAKTAAKAKKAVYRFTGFCRGLHPFAIHCGKVRKPNSHRVPTHRVVVEAQLNGLAFSDFVALVRSGKTKGLAFLDPSIWSVHHKDGNHLNNLASNLEIMSVRAHARRHERENNWRSVVWRTAWEGIKEIRYASVEPVYDLTVDDLHNYVANGFVVHNCGIGKTSTALSAAVLRNAHRVLIVTRAIGRDVWPRDGIWAAEEKNFNVVLGRVVLEPTKGQEYAVKRANRKLEDLRAKGARVEVSWKLDRTAWANIVSWETIEHHKAAILEWSPDLVIFDESHYAKGRLASRAETARDIAKGRLCWLLTATPVRDRLRDLWGQLALSSSAAWGTSWAFVHRYCDAKPGRYGGLDSTGVSNVDELKARLSYWYSFRTRREIQHLLPAKSIDIIRLPSDEIEKAALGSLRFDRATSTIESSIAIASDAKRHAVVDRVVQALMGGEKVVVTGNRRAWVPKILEHILGETSKIRKLKENLTSFAVTGETPIGDRQAIAREYMDAKGPALFIATIDSISEAIDLQDTDRLIVSALPYTPGSLVQLLGRVYRLGQRRPVTIDFFVLEGSIDEVVEQTLLSKMDAIEEAACSTEMPGESLRDSGPSQEEVMMRLAAWLKESEEKVA